MGWKERERAVRARAALVQELGGRCQGEGCDETDPEELEIDHINGRDWVPSKKSSDHRVSIYRREATQGKLRVLCKTCNSSFGFRRGGRNKKRRERVV
jgi:hypothetical protein